MARTQPAAEAAPETYGPASLPYTISSGRPCTLTQPDMFDLASGTIDLPSFAKQDVWELLLRYTSKSDPQQQLLSDEKFIRSHYYAAQLALSPRLKLDDDDEEGVIDRRELSLPDLLAIYDFCRFGRAPNAPRAESGPAADAVPPVGDGQGAE